MKYIKISPLFVGALLGLVILYFAIRLPNLTYQPIFADEAIYIRWAQIIKSEPTLRFISVSDGKTPLYMWTLAPVLKFIEDPLLAGRLLSVIAGFGTLLAVITIGLTFFTRRVALWAGFIMVITPYIWFFDRMALVDSMLATFSTWSLFGVLLVAKYKRLDLAMILGFLLGGGLLTKTPAMFNLVCLPFSLLLVKWKSPNRQIEFLKLTGLLGVSAIIAQVIYNILRLGPGFGSLNSRNGDYVFSPAKLLITPFDPFIPHLKDLLEWWQYLLGWPLALLVVIAIIKAIWSRQMLVWVVLAWGLVPTLIEMALLQTFTARYLLFPLIPLLFLAAWAIVDIAGQLKPQLTKVWIPLVMLSLLVWPTIFGYYYWTDLAKLPLPVNERRGYLEDWTAGYGMKEIADFLIQQTRNSEIVVGTAGGFGTLPDGLEIYLDRYNHHPARMNRIIVKPGTATISADLYRAAQDRPTYYVANRSQYPETTNGFEVIKEYSKIVGPTLSPDAVVLLKYNPELIYEK